jgi:hypothetical protein
MDKDSRYMYLRFERIWFKEFQEQANPFIAYQWWISEEQRERRRVTTEFFAKGISNGKELL